MMPFPATCQGRAFLWSLLFAVFQNNREAMPKPFKKKTRLILAFVILCACTVLILFTGPGFGFVWQVLISCILLFVLFWLIT